MMLLLEGTGADTYIYAPKNDVFHRTLWRRPYPVDQLARFDALRAFAASHHVTFRFGLSPFLDYDPTRAHDFRDRREGGLCERLKAAMEANMISIDGSEGEGGGQVLRSALALSMIRGVPFRMENIRAKRSRPGLLRQHLTALRAAAQVSSARLTGDEMG